jgi:hypothetical protein
MSVFWISLEDLGLNIVCPAQSVSKIKYYVTVVTKCIGKSDTFSNTAPHQVSYVLIRSKYGYH